MPFPNQRAFDDPTSRLAAMGADLRASTAITDPDGRVLAHARTGGMLSPARWEIARGTNLFRFGSRAAGATRVAGGAWWLDQRAFDRLARFAQVEDLAIGMAMRLLCLVPPEWSDATLLVRARAIEPVLCWRGLADSVVVRAPDGGPPVRMPHRNADAERRLHQLFIPGAAEPSVRRALAVEEVYPLDAAAGRRGFLYR